MGETPQFLVGTASWTDPTLVNSDLFYPRNLTDAEQRLKFYAAHFPTVEVDSSFYVLLSERVAQLWAERTPADFVFNVKAFAWLTQHSADSRRLPAVIKSALPAAARAQTRIARPPTEVLDLAFQMFWNSLQPLRAAKKMGRVMFQLPPYLTRRPSNLEYLATLPQRMPGAEIAVEFRHHSWMEERYRASTLSFLREHGLAYVSIDAPPAARLTALLETSSDDAYVRFHGHNNENWFKHTVSVAERFKYLYAERELADWAGKLRQLRVRRAFAIFNNCYSNFGIMNASTMREMLSHP